jgi:hypothetical protein
MRNSKSKHKNDSDTMSDFHLEEADKAVLTEDSALAFEAIKSLGRKEIAEGRG